MFSTDLARLSSSVERRKVLPSLVLFEQTSNKSESYDDPDYDSPVSVYVKNAPFRMKIGTVDQASSRVGLIDLHQVRFDLGLLYASQHKSRGRASNVVSDDNEDESSKPVSAPGFEPLAWKVDVSDRGDEAIVECRIRVLTSQHEHSLFQVRVAAVNPDTGQDFNPPLFLVTQPIRVISKPDKQKPSCSLASSSKASPSDKLVEAVERIERQQEEQQKLVLQLIDLAKSHAPHSHEALLSVFSSSSSSAAGLSSLSSNAASSSSSLSTLTKPELPRSPTLTSSSSSSALFETDPTTALGGFESLLDPSKKMETAFEEAFTQFFEAYIQSTSKADDVRKIIKSCPPSGIEHISQFLEDLAAATSEHNQALADPLLAPSTDIGLLSRASSQQCACGSQCPYARELEHVDFFYRDFLNNDMVRDLGE